MAWACIHCRIWLWPEDAACFSCGAANPAERLPDGPAPAFQAGERGSIPPLRSNPLWICLPSGALRGYDD